MSDAEKPKRRFWQFHLSTAVVLVLAAGVLICVNLADRMRRSEDPRDSELNALISRGIHARYGWPFIAKDIYYPGFLDFSHATGPDDIPTSKWSPTGVVVDSLVAAGSLLALASACESIIRRREARKT